jgi:hypothetical protein
VLVQAITFTDIGQRKAQQERKSVTAEQRSTDSIGGRKNHFVKLISANSISGH